MSITPPDLIRARTRRPGQRWKTTSVGLSGFISEHPNKYTGGTDKRSYFTLTTADDGVEIRLKWSEVTRLHAALGNLMDTTSTMIESDAQAAV